MKDAYWQAEFMIQEEYDFGIIQLDCKIFKNQVINTIQCLKDKFEEHLIARFQVFLWA